MSRYPTRKSRRMSNGVTWSRLSYNGLGWWRQDLNHARLHGEPPMWPVRSVKLWSSRNWRFAILLPLRRA